MASKNGIKGENYIVIDCRKSEFKWIIDNMSSNKKINELFNIQNIDWGKAEKFALSNLIKIACEYKRNNPSLFCDDIGSIMGCSGKTINKWLKIGSNIQWCEYYPKYEHKRGTLNNGMNSRKTVEIFKHSVSLGIFVSTMDLERRSEELFGTKLLNSAISSVCLGKKTQYKGYTFKYVEEELKEVANF